MVNHDWYWEITQLKRELEKIRTAVDEIKSVVRPEQELWDNSDMTRYWKVSTRTLSDWRVKDLIEYVQVGNKIWYPLEARKLFLKMNYHEINGGGKDEK